MLSRTLRGTALTAVTALALLVAQAGTAARSGGPKRHASAGSASVAMFNREAFPYSARVSTKTEANRYQVMVLQWTDGALVRRLHAANRRLKVLVYADALMSQAKDPHQFGGGCTNFLDDQLHHREWFVHDAHGSTVPSRAYADNYLMNVGDPGYQQACIRFAIDHARAAGFDGVYFDDLTAWVGFAVPQGVTVPAYPTYAAWQAAVYSFIVAAASQVHAAGLLLIGNIGGARATPGLWQRWNTQLDGAEEQGWTDAGLGLSDQIFDWATKLSWVRWSEAHHKYALLHSENTTAAGNEYGLASMMLVAGGWSSYSSTNHDSSAPDVWRGSFSRARSLGRPLGAYGRLANGVYVRRFAKGIVLVNPTASTVRRFGLHGRYRGTPGTVGSVALGPTSGLILNSAR